MIEHPWVELQVLLKEKWLTQKEFSSILWKKVSELNELLKWKRNVTIQRDYLLHQALWTPIKYWILKQIDYDYSQFNTKEFDNIEPVAIDNNPKEQNNLPKVEPEESMGTSNEVNEDTKERARIFRSF